MRKGARTVIEFVWENNGSVAEIGKRNTMKAQFTAALA